MKIALQNKYIEYLKELNRISNVEVFEAGIIKFTYRINEKEYSFLFASLDEYKLPCVLLCNSKDEISNKPHMLYLDKNELFYLCLSIREDISVRNKDYREIINYTLIRIEKLMTMSHEEERREFRKEFLYFWNKCAENKNKIQLYINSSSQIKVLKPYNKKDIDIYIDDDININDIFLKQDCKTKKSVIYIPLINSNLIMPPVGDKKWSADEVRYIINNCVSEENIETLEKLIIVNKEVFLVFEMYVPGVVPISFVLKLKFKSSKNKTILSGLDEIMFIEYLKSERCDTEYLFRRIGVKNRLRDKKILIVGAGSLGSYIISELPKIGVKNITIIDPDDINMENIMRHSLGANYSNYSKVFSMKFDLELEYPEVEVNINKSKFNVDNMQEYNLSEYDLIIIATGGTDYMIKLNKAFKELKIDTPVLFTWIESRGIGVHALAVNYNRTGCFNCLYTNSDTNKAHFSNKNYKDELTGTGCGGVINQYGNIVLLKGSAMILNIILDMLNSNKINDNILFSVKTLNEYIFNNGDISLGGDTLAKTSYKSEGCEICGIKI
ncbi:ThiF family adenylyltransferase [uncultured Clostridium sp.]|uniref:ThiF family adenylyltransferase n=1 Tax=uncultured Clostridium sp. TaxID=59620 RepID=UPI0025DD0D95|nr:ThiF family adenylyltransferase [uncultured Clostridium sp.]